MGATTYRLQSIAFGDSICAIPAIRTDMQGRTGPFYIDTAQHDLFKWAFPDAIIKQNGEVFGESRVVYPDNFNLNAYWATLVNTHHLAAFSFHSLGIIDRLNGTTITYPRYKGTRNPAYRKHVGISAAYIEQARSIPPAIVAKIIHYLERRGYIPVYIGNTSRSGTQIDNLPSCLDFRNKFDFLETLDFLNSCAGIITPDSGLLHLAGLTDAEILVAFTTIRPEIRIPIRKESNLGWHIHVLIPGISCQFCKSRGRFGKKFYECSMVKDFPDGRSVVAYPDPLPCVHALTWEKWRTGIIQMLEARERRP